jgi:tRNA(fMet)-specific endonuclease VapC
VSGRSQTARQSFKLHQEQATMAISTITEAEILFGLESKPAAPRLRRSVEELFGTLQILASDSNAAYAYGRLRARLAAAGKSLAALDMLLAAHALSANAVLVTHDKAFLQITASLNVIDWATDL